MKIETTNEITKVTIPRKSGNIIVTINVPQLLTKIWLFTFITLFFIESINIITDSRRCGVQFTCSALNVGSLGILLFYSPKPGFKENVKKISKIYWLSSVFCIIIIVLKEMIGYKAELWKIFYDSMTFSWLHGILSLIILGIIDGIIAVWIKLSFE